MALIKIDEPFAKAPKRKPLRSPAPWDGTLETNGEFAEISAATIDGVSVYLEGATRLEIEGSRLSATTLLDAGSELEIQLADSEVERSDFSRLRFSLVRQSRLEGVKLTGTDFSGALIRDSEFVDCVLHLANFAMATLERVRFTNCVLDDVDAYNTTLTDIDFPGTRLKAFNVDKATAARVDLRESQIESLKGVTNLSGFLISDHQLPALSYQLADAVGLQIEDDS